MGRGKEITVEEAKTIIKKHKKGFLVTHISRVMKRSKSAISNILNGVVCPELNKKRKRGRKTILSEREIRLIQRSLRKNPF